MKKNITILLLIVLAYISYVLLYENFTKGSFIDTIVSQISRDANWLEDRAEEYLDISEQINELEEKREIIAQELNQGGEWVYSGYAQIMEHINLYTLLSGDTQS